MSIKKDLREELIKQILEWQERKAHVFNEFLKPLTRHQMSDMEVVQLEIELENIIMKK